MSILSTKESAEQILVRSLNESDLPCTYSNIRGVLAWLSDKLPQGDRTKILPLLWERLSTYQVARNDTDILYILCQVARAVVGEEPQQDWEERLATKISYAIGITALLANNHPQRITKLEALEHLLDAYKHDKALDIQLAMLIIYEKLGYFNLSQALLQKIVTRIADNIDWLLKIPQPLKINEDLYENQIQKQKKGPGINELLIPAKKDITNIINDYLDASKVDASKVKEAEERLKKIKNRVRKIQILELELNIAICRTLQGDWEGALSHLSHVEKVASTLDWKNSNISQVREAYYQLAMYVYYKLGRFQQVQNIVAQAVEQDFQPWLQTWLGYVFLAKGNYQLSKETIRSDIQSGNSKHFLRKEYILLQLYWQSANQVTKLEKIEEIRKLIFDTNSNKWNSVNLTVRFSPELQDKGNKNVRKAFDYKKYDVPDLVLYRDNAESIPRDLKTAKELVELALHAADFSKAKDILETTDWRNDPDAIISFYEELLLDPQQLLVQMYKSDELKPRIEKLKNWIEKLRSSGTFVLDKSEYPTNNKVRELIERWMKSPYQPELVGIKLAKLLKESPALLNLYWRRQDLRDQIWQALDFCLDYGCVEDILPNSFTLEALADAVFHLLYVGKVKLVKKLIEATQDRFNHNNAENLYCQLLAGLSQSETSVEEHKKLYYLRLLSGLPDRPSVQIHPEERQEAISALEILAEYPDANRQAATILLLGEQLQKENAYQAASTRYSQVALEIAGDDKSRLLAALRLMSLCARYPQEVSWSKEQSEDLGNQGKGWQVKERPLGRLLAPLTELLSNCQSDEERTNFAEVLKNLEVVIEALHNKEEYEPESIKSILDLLPQLPEGKLWVLPLYENLVGITPLKGDLPKDKNLEEILRKFSEEKLASEDLQKEINNTLEIIIAEWERKAKESNVKKDYNIRDEWNSLRNSLDQMKA